MDYSQELISEIEKKAEKMMTPTEIAALLNLDETMLLDDINTVGHPVRRAFLRGMATTAESLRENIHDAAIAGSPYSIAVCQQLLNNMINQVSDI